jgi:hypothetical protein
VQHPPSQADDELVSVLRVAVARWAEWAMTMVEQWPDDPSQATPDRAAIEEIARRATW